MGIRAVLPEGDMKTRRNCGELYRLAREYREFPCYTAPAALLKRLGENLPVLILSLMFAPAVVGFFAVANRLIRLPVGLIQRIAAQSLPAAFGSTV